jgi:site-specific DNA-methyltransferase (adenine-specific)
MHQFGPIVSDVWTDIHRIRHKKRHDEHPCQLPVHLLERLLLMTTDEGDIVLDPFVGTGTTAIAAKRLGCRFIGIDIDPSYVEMTKKKLEKTNPNMLDGCYVSIFLERVITIKDKDWEKVKDSFVVAREPLQLEKSEIQLKVSKIVNLERENKDRDDLGQPELFTRLISQPKAEYIVRRGKK